MVRPGSLAGGVAEGRDESGADEQADGSHGGSIELHAVIVGPQQERDHAVSTRGGGLAHTVVTGDDHVAHGDAGVSCPFGLSDGRG